MNVTEERHAEREDEDLRSLAGIGLVCVLYAITSALYTYLTTGGF